MSSARRLPLGLMVKLSLMMFLQFFIWGAWFEIGFSYIPGLKFEQSWMNPLVFGAFNIGALVALFFSTQFADRKFAAEKFLSISHLIGGAAILGLAFLQAPVGTKVGELNSARIVELGADGTTGVGMMADGTTVTVLNAVKPDDADKAGMTAEQQAKLDEYAKASKEERAKADNWKGLGAAAKFRAVFDADKKAFDAATEDERKEKKLTDPRFTTTFLVKEAGGTMTGDAKAALAPFWPFFLLMLLHSVFYVPTISITNAIAFNAFTDPDKQFGPVRLWGTVGWIAASWPFIFILTNWAVVPAFGSVPFGDWLGKVFANPLSGAAELDGKKYVFLASGLASLALAAFSLTLPHTPPKPATGEDSLAWLKAMKLLAHPFVFVLFVVTFLDAAVHQSYFFWTFDFLAGPVGIPSNWAGATMKIGQVAEVVTMLALGWVLKTFGWRLTMTVGVLGHVARFAVFAFFPEKTPVILVIALHGICYAFFFATVYIFVDKYFPKDVRSSAQGLFNVLILGVGPFVANFACEQLKGVYSTGGAVNYPAVFQYSMYAGLAGAALLLLFFHPPKEPKQVG
jgi:MFS family permease